MDAPFSGPVGRDEIVARIAAHPVHGSYRARREAFARLTLGDDASAEPRTPLRIDGEGATIVYLHGGGYVFGSPQTHRRIAVELAQRTGVSVVAPAYPLAPEYVWPAQLEAAMGAVSGVEGPVVLAGDSAGGHLALVTALELARRGRRAAGLVLFSPNTDRTGLSCTRERNNPRDPMVDAETDRDLALLAFAGLADDDPQVSPVLDVLDLLPPLYIEVGKHEVLLGDSLLLAERARRAAITVTLHVDAQGLHMMQLWAPWWPVAAASLDRASCFVRTVVGSRGGGRGTRDSNRRTARPSRREGAGR